MATPFVFTGTAPKKGDALCATIDPISGLTTVAQANAAALANNKTVFGVAAADAAGPNVSVHLVNEIVPAATSGLAAGVSNIIAVDANNPDPTKQMRLFRVPRPDGSEHVVGTCDENRICRAGIA